MRASALLPLALLLTTALSAPLAKQALALQTYNEFSISAGVAGKVKAEALAKFPVDMSNLAGVSAADIATIQTERESADSAETEAFDPAIAAASGTAATALQNGKIKNKVLKLTGEVLVLQIQAAQGADNAAKITQEQTKLTNNINLDIKAAGQTSTAVSFDS